MNNNPIVVKKGYFESFIGKPYDDVEASLKKQGFTVYEAEKNEVRPGLAMINTVFVIQENGIVTDVTIGDPLQIEKN